MVHCVSFVLQVTAASGGPVNSC